MAAAQRGTAPGIAYLAQEQPTGFVLGFVAGFVDIASYMTLFGLFSSNMTGNVLLAAVALVQPGAGSVTSRVAAVPVFMLGSLLGWALRTWARSWNWPVASILLAGEALALSLFLVAGEVLGPRLQNASQLGLIVAVGFFSLIAMGMQNVLARELFADLPVTIAMTNNLSSFVLDSAELLCKRLRGQPLVQESPTLQHYTVVVPVLSGFALGALAGSYALHQIAWWGLAFPIACLALLAAATYPRGIEGNAHERSNK